MSPQKLKRFRAPARFLEADIPAPAFVKPSTQAGVTRCKAWEILRRTATLVLSPHGAPPLQRQPIRSDRTKGTQETLK